MSFFAGASNIKIIGGEFNDIKGNYTVFDYSRHETNYDSNNTSHNNVIDSFNNNSTRISGQIPGSRSPNDEDDPMQSRADDQGEDSTVPPPPQHPPFMPQQIPSAGPSQVTNLDSFNIKDTQFNDVFNNNSKTYYCGPAPPMDQDRRAGPQEGKDEHHQSNAVSIRSGQPPKGPVQMPFQPGVPPHMGNGANFGPSLTVNYPIQNMGPDMRRNFEKVMQFARSQTESMVPKNGDNPNNAIPTLNTRMATLSIDDRMASSTSSHPIGAAQLSPPLAPPFSRNKSEPQIAVQPPHPIGSPSPSNLGPYNNALTHSHSNPSMAPHMKETSMVTFLAPPTVAQQADNRGNNDLNSAAPVSTSAFTFPPTSSGGPVFRTIEGDFTKHNHTVHQTNINSFNTENNLIQNSFNDNSLVDSSGKQEDRAKEQGKPLGPDPPIKTRNVNTPPVNYNGKTSEVKTPEESCPSDEPDEKVDQRNGFVTPQVPSAAKGTLNNDKSPGKLKKVWFSRRK